MKADKWGKATKTMHYQTLDFSNMCLTFKEYSMPPGVNFINVFTHSFYACRSQKRKKAPWVECLFAILGSACIRATCKMLVKLTYNYFNGIMVFRNAVLRDTFRDDLFLPQHLKWNLLLSCFFPPQKSRKFGFILDVLDVWWKKGRMLLPMRVKWERRNTILLFNPPDYWFSRTEKLWLALHLSKFTFQNTFASFKLFQSTFEAHLHRVFHEENCGNSAQFV